MCVVAWGWGGGGQITMQAKMQTIILLPLHLLPTPTPPPTPTHIHITPLPFHTALNVERLPGKASTYGVDHANSLIYRQEDSQTEREMGRQIEHLSAMYLDWQIDTEQSRAALSSSVRHTDRPVEMNLPRHICPLLSEKDWCDRQHTDSQ